MFDHCGKFCRMHVLLISYDIIYNSTSFSYKTLNVCNLLILLFLYINTLLLSYYNVTHIFLFFRCSYIKIFTQEINFILFETRRFEIYYIIFNFAYMSSKGFNAHFNFSYMPSKGFNAYFNFYR